MVEITIPDNWISNALKVGGVLIVLVMVATLIKPSITGNVVSTVNELKANLTECQMELESQTNLATSLESDLVNVTSSGKECMAELTDVVDERSELRTELDDLRPVYENIVKELNQSENDYEELALFAARATCCSRKYSGEPDIDSYNIVGNEIKCLEDNDGTFELECS